MMKCAAAFILGTFSFTANASIHQRTRTKLIHSPIDQNEKQQSCGIENIFRELRGGSTRSRSQDPYVLLASALRPRLFSSRRTTQIDETKVKADPSNIQRALEKLSSAQLVLKSVDGAAHEAYQRATSGFGRSKSKAGSARPSSSSSSSDSKLDGVAGRAARSAVRAGSAADALFAGELCELVERPYLNSVDHSLGPDGTLSSTSGREVLLNITVNVTTPGQNVPPLRLSVLVVHEESYEGGAGLDHGGINQLLQNSPGNSFASSDSTRRGPKRRTPPRGRILVVIGDDVAANMRNTLQRLDEEPVLVPIRAGLVAAEAASVSGIQWRGAAAVLEAIQPILAKLQPKEEVEKTSMNETSTSADGGATNPKGSRKILPQNLPAVHFVGRSLAGGVACLAAAIFDGTLPMSQRQQKRKVADHPPLEGGGRGRTSAVALGPPPCLSSNLKVAFVTAIINGDDMIARATSGSIDRLCQRTVRTMKAGFVGKRIGWMSDAVSLTFSGLQSHAHGSEGEEAKLSIPGRIFIVRPRRLGGTSSMHQVGVGKGTESLRAAVLWQLQDILLSRSMWAHHSLDSYIDVLNRVKLRGVADNEEGDEDFGDFVDTMDRINE